MYLLTETASPFALERWAAFFANFGQFAKGFFYTLGISIGALIVALLLGLIFGNLPKHTLACAIRGCLLWDFNID